MSISYSLFDHWHRWLLIVPSEGWLISPPLPISRNLNFESVPSPLFPSGFLVWSGLEHGFNHHGFGQRPHHFKSVRPAIVLPAPFVRKFGAFTAKLFGFLSIDGELDEVTILTPLAVVPPNHELINGVDFEVLLGRELEDKLTSVFEKMFELHLHNMFSEAWDRRGIKNA